jgi:hypothetical protein
MPWSSSLATSDGVAERHSQCCSPGEARGAVRRRTSSTARSRREHGLAATPMRRVAALALAGQGAWQARAGRAARWPPPRAGWGGGGGGGGVGGCGCAGCCPQGAPFARRLGGAATRLEKEHLRHLGNRCFKTCCCRRERRCLCPTLLTLL